MRIKKIASCGTLESSDAYVEIEPAECGVSVSVQSIVEKQFGRQIENSVREVLAECGVEGAIVRISDRGALDCVIRARVETAICRAGGEE